MRKFFDNFEEYIMLILFPAMVIVVLTATFARYSQLFSIFWGEELARYIMIYMAYIGIALAMKRHAHVGVTALVERFPSRAGKKFFLIVQTFAILAFCVIITWLLSGLIAKQASIGQTSPALTIPMWIPYASVPLGMILLFIRTIQGCLRSWRTIEEGK